MSQYSNKNKLVVPGAKNAIDQMKYEIANELGVNLGPDAVSYTHLDVYKRQLFEHVDQYLDIMCH